MDAENRYEKVRAAIRLMERGAHACTLYDSRDAEAAMAGAYVSTGLERGERCVCILDDGEEIIAEGLAAEGVDVEAERKAGRLLFFHKPGSNLATRDMDGQIAEWASSALAAGFNGCRVTGEMTWALDGGFKELAGFEARLDLSRVWQRHRCMGMCQFDVRRFTQREIREMIILHKFIVVGDHVCRNPYYVPPEAYLASDWPERETEWMIANLERLHCADDELRASHDEYRYLTRRLVSLQDAERRDLARELHDRLGQNLTAMRINMDLIRRRLGALNDPAILDRAEDSMQLIDSTFKAVRDVMYELRPPMLEESGLAASLRWYADGFTERTGIRVGISANEELRMAPDVEIALFRVAQEALNNVARHSHARNVRIELRRSGGAVDFTMEDDGAGFEDGRTANIGYGIATMRERAEAVGGTFAMSSEKGRGTRVQVNLPRSA